MCFVTCEGGVLWALGETEKVDTATIYKMEMITKVIARGTSGCAKHSVECSTVKTSAWMLRMVRMMLGQCLMNWRAQLTSCIARQLKLRKRVREGMTTCNRISIEFYREPIELIGGKTGRNECAIMSTIVERTEYFKLSIVQTVIAVKWRPVYILREIE